MQLSRVIIISILVFAAIWLFLFAHVSRSPVEGTDKSSSMSSFSSQAAETLRAASESFQGSGVLSSATAESVAHLPSVSRQDIREKVTREPPSPEDVMDLLNYFLEQLHGEFAKIRGVKATPESIWETYFRVTEKILYTWDKEHEDARYPVRSDNSIFVSVASYRDEYCPSTLQSMYEKAKHPENIFIGLVQQNCVENCKSGVLEGLRVENVGPDPDCFELFCKESPMGPSICSKGQVRLFDINETESLGPYMGRYFGAKLYQGETFYLQIDSHSYFADGWDEELISMVHNAPTEKAVISSYPPPHNFKNWENGIGFRMCDAQFSLSDIESQILRIDPSTKFDKDYSPVPRYAPYVAAGFIFAPGEILYEVPIDPFLPYIFMGEEISMSARFWTAGWDIFSPTRNVLSHIYVRRHLPKFWETVNRLFGRPVFNKASALILRRVKNLIGYPETATELISPPSLLAHLDEFGFGRVRPYHLYLRMIGIDPFSKTVVKPQWCRKGTKPEIVMDSVLGIPKEVFAEKEVMGVDA